MGDTMSKPRAVDLGAIEQFPVGQGWRFVINDQVIAVFRARDGKVFAVEDRCPHRQGPLSDGIIGDGHVVCPLHGHKFDLETGQGGEGHECVHVFKAWVLEGKMMVECRALKISKDNQQE